MIWTPGITLDESEKFVIQQALKHFRGNKTHTANALGIAVRTLDNKLEKYESEQKQLDDSQSLQEEKNAKMLRAQRGLHVEQSPVVAAKQPVPVRVGQEVQEVPPQQDATSDTNASQGEGVAGGSSEEKAGGGSKSGKGKGGRKR